jgi:hypothetical protein
MGRKAWSLGWKCSARLRDVFACVFGYNQIGILNYPSKPQNKRESLQNAEQI